MSKPSAQPDICLQHIILSVLLLLLPFAAGAAAAVAVSR
jgi:hypothetical protein